MTSRRRGRFLVLLVCAWFYGALLFLYPKSFRLRYSAELRRDFFGLSREALREGGILGVVRVWAHAFSALALTALRQRRNTLPMERRIASGVVMMVQVPVIAVIVGMVSFWQAPPYAVSSPMEITKQPGEAPIYEAAGFMWTAEKPTGHRARVTTYREGGFGLMPPGRAEKVERIRNATHTRSVAKEVIQRMGLKMKPAELLDNLAIEHEEVKMPPDWSGYRKSTLVERTYKDTDPQRAERILDMVGKVAFENSDRIGYQRAAVPHSPAVPHPSKNAWRNGLLTLGVGLLLCPLVKHRELTYVLSRLDRGDTSLMPPLDQIGARKGPQPAP